jgi:hypothetical protein
MKVTFLRDFRGRSTGEAYYTAGTVVDLPDWQAAACLAEGVILVVSVAEVLPLELPAAAPSPAAAGSFVNPGAPPEAESALPGGAPATPAKPARKRAAKKSAK